MAHIECNPELKQEIIDFTKKYCKENNINIQEALRGFASRDPKNPHWNALPEGVKFSIVFEYVLGNLGAKQGMSGPEYFAHTLSKILAKSMQ